jgi:AraC family transcriptional activator of tynA and feaB
MHTAWHVRPFGGVGAGVTVLLDTDLIPRRERADALHAAYDGQDPRRTVFVADGPVRHRVERVALGPEAHLLRTGGSALHVVRTARQIRGDAPEYVAIGVHHLGEAVVSAAGVDDEIPVGQLNCVDMTSPYRLVHTTANRHDVLILSNRQAGVPVDVVRAAVPALTRSPVYDLVRRHLAGLFQATCELAPEPRMLVGRATSALIGALLTTAAEARGGAEAMDVALPTRIALHIDTHLTDRDLTVEGIAAAHSISVRHLYNLWSRAGHDLTPAQWIVDRRLQRARELLTTTDPARTTIAAVARRCGFADSSHFARRFRAASGMSPGEWRAANRNALRG